MTRPAGVLGRALVLVVLAAVPGRVLGQTPASQDPRLLFLKGNEAAERQDFDLAIQSYEAILAQGAASGAVHFNLANACFKAGRLGAAIYHYRLAQRLLPRDEEVAFNLSTARERVVDRVNRSEMPGFLRTLLFFHVSTTLREARDLFLALFVLAFVAFHARLFVRRTAVTRIAVALAVLAVLAGVSLLVRTTLSPPAPEAVVLPAEALVRSGPSPDYPEHFKLHEGVEAKIEEERAGWLKIDVDGKKGWIPKTAAGRIEA